jgi:hypothetical protein
MMRVACVGVVLWIVALLPAPARPAGEDLALASTRLLAQRLARSGRAEVRVRATVEDPLTGAPRTIRGTLSLERPQFARLDFETGERLALRADGGEWLQPETRQLLVAGPKSTNELSQWWTVLLEERRVRFRETKVGPREYRLVPMDAEAGSEDGQRITLGADGLPSRLVVISGGAAPRTYHLSGWRFARPRGARAFTLEAPAGYETIRLH